MAEPNKKSGEALPPPQLIGMSFRQSIPWRLLSSRAASAFPAALILKSLIPFVYFVAANGNCRTYTLSQERAQSTPLLRQFSVATLRSSV